MTEEKITNLENLPKNVWEDLKRSSESMIQNSKIAYFQGIALRDLASSKISEFKTDDDKKEDEALKDLIKEVVA